MLFFQSKPSIPVHDKARLEFRLQQTTDCVGANRMKLPVLSAGQLVPNDTSTKSESILDRIAEHLGFDFSGLSIQESLSVLQKKSGGGG